MNTTQQTVQLDSEDDFYGIPDEQQQFEVDKILGKRLKGKGKRQILQYKVLWKGYNEEECTWEPIANLSSAMHLVAEYEDYNEALTQIFKKRKEEKLRQKRELRQLNLNQNQNQHLVPGKTTLIASGSSQNNSQVQDLHSRATPHKKARVINLEASAKTERKKDLQQQQQDEQQELNESTDKSGRGQEQKNVSDEKDNNIQKQQLETEEQISQNVCGSYELGDKAWRIASTPHIKGQMHFEIEWMFRENAKEQPKNTVCTMAELEENDPDLLIDFYESKIKFVGNKKTKSDQQQIRSNNE